MRLECTLEVSVTVVMTKFCIGPDNPRREANDFDTKEFVEPLSKNANVLTPLTIKATIRLYTLLLLALMLPLLIVWLETAASLLESRGFSAVCLSIPGTPYYICNLSTSDQGPNNWNTISSHEPPELWPLDFWPWERRIEICYDCYNTKHTCRVGISTATLTALPWRQVAPWHLSLQAFLHSPQTDWKIL